MEQLADLGLRQPERLVPQPLDGLNVGDDAARERVEVAAHRRVGDAKRAPKLGRIPELRVVVREHGPEALEGRRRHAETELTKLTLEVRAHELLAPLKGRGLGSCQERAGKAAAKPQLLEGVCRNLVARKAAELVEGDASGEGLGALTQERG